MPISKRISILAILCVSLGICLLSAIRLKYIIELGTDDFTGSLCMYAILATLEPILGIISACLPVVPAIFRHYSDNRVMAWCQRDRNSTSSKHALPTLPSLGISAFVAELADFERPSENENQEHGV